MKKIAVIGGGIGGLACAYELCLAGWQPTLYETADAPGGLAQGFVYQGVEIERFYHHLYTHDTEIIDYIQQFGLEKKLVWKEPTTSSFYGNNFFRLSTPLDLLKFKPLPLIDRIRMGLVVFCTQYFLKEKNLHNQTAAEWLRRLAGQKAYKILWEPLLRNKFGSYHEQIAASWLWSKFKKRGASRDNLGREKLGYLEGGFGQLFRALAKGIENQGGQVYLNHYVSEIIIDNNQISGLMVNGEKLFYDAIIFTGHLPELLVIAPNLPPNYRAKLAAIKYFGNICLALFLDRSLNDVYWLNVNDPNFPFVGVIQHSELLPLGAPDNAHVAYISRYLDIADPAYSYSAKELLAEYEPYIRKLFPDFSASWVKDCLLWKAKYAQPLVTVGYKDLIPGIKTPVKGLYLSTMAQIYPDDRQMSNAIKLAKKSVRAVANDFTLIQ